MSENSKIEWTDHTFNPWEGCQKVGPGCDHCYAETRNARFAGGSAINWGPSAPRRRTSAANWRKPLQWNAAKFWQCECGWRGSDRELDQQPKRSSNPVGDIPACPNCNRIDFKPARARVFCASLADVFDNAVNAQWRFELLKLIEETPNLDWLLLTKRIRNASTMLEQATRAITHGREGWADNYFPNVWIGASIVNQEEADRDIPKLLAVPAQVRFLSMEPLLGPVDLRQAHKAPVRFPHIDWVIVGGESGTGARPMHPDWARSLRDQCTSVGVPFLFKQWGEFSPTERSMAEVSASVVKHHIIPYSETSLYPAAAVDRVGKKAAGRLLDGVQHDGYPESS